MASTVHQLHEHGHHRSTGVASASRGERRTRWVVLITLAMMVVELVVGWTTGSLALTADGWHMGTHAGAFGLTLLAYWYARTRADHDAFAFGTGKVYALAGYTSAILLGGVAVWMGVEAISRLQTRPDVAFAEALPVAIAGLAVNVVSAVLLMGGKKDERHAHGEHEHEHEHEHHGHRHGHDHNLRAAYLHVIADALTSVLAIVALVLGYWQGWWYFDPAMGLVGGAVILYWAVGLSRSAARQLLDVVPSAEHERLVKHTLESIDDVRVADLHVWELGPGQRSCVVSLVTATPRAVEFYKQAILDTVPVAHLTIEIHHCADCV